MWRSENLPSDAALYIILQVFGAVLSVWISHGMFALEILQISTRVCSSLGQWLAECVATFGLVFTILSVRVHRPEALAGAVALYIVAACWFTASTFFANPAVTLARAISDTYAGIRPTGVFPFIVFQVIGVFSAQLCGDFFMFREK